MQSDGFFCERGKPIRDSPVAIKALALKRENLPGIKDTVRIERLLDSAHDRDLLGGAGVMEKISLQEPHAVFSGDTSVVPSDTRKECIIKEVTSCKEDII